MQKYTIKTSMACGACVAAVSKKLNALEGVEKWSVDLDSADKILTVEAQNLQQENIVEAVRAAGFAAEPLPQQ